MLRSRCFTQEANKRCSTCMYRHCAADSCTNYKLSLSLSLMVCLACLNLETTRCKPNTLSPQGPAAETPGPKSVCAQRPCQERSSWRSHESRVEYTRPIQDLYKTYTMQPSSPPALQPSSPPECGSRGGLHAFRCPATELPVMGPRFSLP